MKTIKAYKELQNSLSSGKKVFLLLYKEGTEQSDCAHERLAQLDDTKDVLLLKANVNEVRDIHTEYGISTAPSLLEFNEGNLSNVYKGCQTERFYEAAIKGSGFARVAKDDGKPQKRVTVYTTPTCSWCTTIKTYLQENQIQFTEVDVASNPARAEEMVRKSGQQGVPQTDINGQMVIGFDKSRINQLLEIR
jgi:glutaredoxin-like YruB-family protein